MRELKAASGAAIILITHDLGVVAEVCDEVAVMYAGEIVERAAVDELFARPQHPYTVGLLGSIPRLDRQRDRIWPPSRAWFRTWRTRRRAAASPRAARSSATPASPRRRRWSTLSPGHWSRCIKAPLERLVS